MVPSMGSLTVLSMGSLMVLSMGSPMVPLTVLLLVVPSTALAMVLSMAPLRELAASGGYVIDAHDGGDGVSGDAAIDGSA